MMMALLTVLEAMCSVVMMMMFVMLHNFVCVVLC